MPESVAYRGWRVGKLKRSPAGDDRDGEALGEAEETGRAGLRAAEGVGEEDGLVGVKECGSDLVESGGVGLETGRRGEAGEVG